MVCTWYFQLTSSPLQVVLWQGASSLAQQWLCVGVQTAHTRYIVGLIHLEVVRDLFRDYPNEISVVTGEDYDTGELSEESDYWEADDGLDIPESNW